MIKIILILSGLICISTGLWYAIGGPYTTAYIFIGFGIVLILTAIMKTLTKTNNNEES